MHPQVRRIPCGCPECGMALELVIPSTVRDLRKIRGTEHGSASGGGGILRGARFLLAMAHAVPGIHQWFDPDSGVSRWLQFLFSIPVVFWAGLPLFVRGARSIAFRLPNMFTLISMGIGAAFFYSTLALLVPGLFPHTMQYGGKVPVYFESAAVIVTLVLLGQVLESRARRRTGAAIRALLNLVPPTARLVTPEGDAEIPLGRVKPGDLLRVVPGNRIPVDGVHRRAVLLMRPWLRANRSPWRNARGHGNGRYAQRFGSLLCAPNTSAGNHFWADHRYGCRGPAQRAPIQGLPTRLPRCLCRGACRGRRDFLSWLCFGPDPDCHMRS